MISNSSASIAIIDDFHPAFMERLSQEGLSFEYIPEISHDEVYESIKNSGIVAVRSKINFGRELITALPSLKCIARGGAGMDNIDEEFAIEKGITLLNAPEGNRDAVAEHVVGLLLGLSKNIYKSASEVRNFQWHREANRGWEINGKTIGIIGFGNTGSALAKKLSGFDCRVIAYDRFNPEFQSAFAESVSLEELLKVSDVVSLHIPLNQSTQQMLNADFISAMKNGVVLINSSRGKIVSTVDVLNGIKSGKIKSFASDVLENENFDKLALEEKNLLSELYLSNQVIITPHIAGWSAESYERIANVLAEKLVGFTTKIKNI
jgi:D-3-phosphoglycerate dehydrogenase